jgi:hypothetical protein
MMTCACQQDLEGQVIATCGAHSMFLRAITVQDQEEIKRLRTELEKAKVYAEMWKATGDFLKAFGLDKVRIVEAQK